MIIANAVDIPGALGDRNDVRRADAVVPGPWERQSVEMFDAVRTYTDRDDKVAFFKGRALTLFTDRRAVQSSDLAIVLERADWYVMAAHGDGVYPLLTAADAARLGAEEVWHNDAWVLWRLPRGGGRSTLGSRTFNGVDQRA
jgi:UDP-2,3-diacylglucosamine pyrophosphatase LpxH